MRPAAGTLNRRVRIERRTEQLDTWGQPLEVWEEVATVWGNVRTMTGSAYNEMSTGGTEVSRTTASIRIRERSGIDFGMRAVVGDRIYEIRAVLPNEDFRGYMDLSCAIGAREG